jgi:hypothetical protein
MAMGKNPVRGEVLKLDMLLWGVAILVIVLFFSLIRQMFSYNSDGNNVLPGMYGSTTPTPRISAPVTHSPTPLPPASSLPTKTVNVTIDFMSQAPFKIWDPFHEEMCEEITVVMVYAWKNQLSLTPSFADTELYRIAGWETLNFGGYADETAAQIARVAKEIYGIDSTLITDPSIDDIKVELDKGNVVIMGMAGRLLDNPNYKAPGPLYHMLLIKGYDPTGFITNDGGTRLGKDFHFTYDNLMTAAHNWSGSEDTLLSSPAVALIFSKGR